MPPSASRFPESPGTSSHWNNQALITARRAYEQGMDAESCSCLQPQQIRTCWVPDQSPVSEKDILMAPRKSIKVLLDSIASPISALAWRHELQLIMWAMFLPYYKKQLCNQTSALLFGRSIWLLSLGYSQVVHGKGSKSVILMWWKGMMHKGIYFFCSLLQVLNSCDFKYGTHALSPSTCVFALVSLNTYH